MLLSYHLNTAGGGHGGPGGQIIFFVVLAAVNLRARAATPDEAGALSGETIVDARGLAVGYQDGRSSGGSTSRSGPDLHGLVGNQRLRQVHPAADDRGPAARGRESSPCSARQRAAHPVAWPT